MTTHDTARPRFTIVRMMPAALPRVWDAWTVPEEFGPWLHPFGVAVDGVALDARVGGRYAYTMTNEETGERFPTGGEFLEVSPMRRLVMTWGAPDAPVAGTPTLTLDLEERGGRTELSLTLVGFEGMPGDGFVYDGWDQALTNLGRHLAGEPLG